MTPIFTFHTLPLHSADLSVKLGNAALRNSPASQLIKSYVCSRVHKQLSARDKRNGGRRQTGSAHKVRRHNRSGDTLQVDVAQANFWCEARNTFGHFRSTRPASAQTAPSAHT